MKIVIDIPDKVMNSKEFCNYFGAWSTKLDEVIENGTSLKKGTWKPEHCFDHQCRSCYNKCTWFVCSVCRAQGDKDDNFCRNCGADMREEITDENTN
jgi:hypothetical protein